MGIPNMDFTVRELRYCAKGPMAVVRVGTCGSPAETKVGEVTVPTKFHTVLRLPSGFDKPETPMEECYYVSSELHGTDDLIKIL